MAWQEERGASSRRRRTGVGEEELYFLNRLMNLERVDCVLARLPRALPSMIINNLFDTLEKVVTVQSKKSYS